MEVGLCGFNAPRRRVVGRLVAAPLSGIGAVAPRPGLPVDNNDILRRFRYMLSFSDAQVAELCRLGGRPLSPREARARMQREEEPGAVFCVDDLLEAFLDGLIIHLRGRRPPGTPVPTRQPLTNNEVLKKARIAFSLKDVDMLGAMRVGGMTVSKAELTALFRARGHRHHRPCGDQILRKFLVGLTPIVQKRKVAAPGQ